MNRGLSRREKSTFLPRRKKKHFLSISSRRGEKCHDAGVSNRHQAIENPFSGRIAF